MLDLEESLHRVWNPDVRPLIAEAYRSYTTGSARASILLTWSAVAADLIDKLRRLSEDGEGSATAIVQKIDTARDSNDVKAMQEAEASLLTTARSLELLDFVEERELQRLREDRHLCAHPSLRPFGDFYAPTTEYARAHLVAALQSLLIHPPSQGRKVVDRFSAHVADSAFTGSGEYLSHTFFDQVKPTARRQVVDLAVKVACLEPDGLPDPPGAQILGNRMADCLRLFMERDRTLVAQHLKKVTARLGDRPRDVQIRCVGRLGDIDVFWEAVSDPLRDQIKALIGSTLRTPQEINIEEARLVSLVGIDEVRTILPVLEETFTRLDWIRQLLVITNRPGQYFAKYVPMLLSKDVANGFRLAETIAQSAVLPIAPYLTTPDLAAILQAWTDNGQCLMASAMPQLAVTLYESTQHLRPSDEAVWRDFIARVRSLVPEDDPYYRYPALASIIGT